MFHRIKKLRPHHQALFALMIGMAVVAFWRGVWGLMDVYILPENYALSSWISVIIGIVVLGGTHYLTKELA